MVMARRLVRRAADEIAKSEDGLGMSVF